MVLIAAIGSYQVYLCIISTSFSLTRPARECPLVRLVIQVLLFKEIINGSMAQLPKAWTSRSCPAFWFEVSMPCEQLLPSAFVDAYLCWPSFANRQLIMRRLVRRRLQRCLLFTIRDPFLTYGIPSCTWRIWYFLEYRNLEKRPDS